MHRCAAAACVAVLPCSADLRCSLPLQISRATCCCGTRMLTGLPSAADGLPRRRAALNETQSASRGSEAAKLMGSVMIPPGQLVSCELEVSPPHVACSRLRSRHISRAKYHNAQAMPQEVPELRRIVSAGSQPSVAEASSAP